MQVVFLKNDKAKDVKDQELWSFCYFLGRFYARTKWEFERHCKIKDKNLSFWVEELVSWWVDEFFEFMCWWVIEFYFKRKEVTKLNQVLLCWKLKVATSKLISSSVHRLTNSKNHQLINSKTHQLIISVRYPPRQGLQTYHVLFFLQSTVLVCVVYWVQSTSLQRCWGWPHQRQCTKQWAMHGYHLSWQWLVRPQHRACLAKQKGNGTSAHQAP